MVSGTEAEGNDGGDDGDDGDVCLDCDAGIAAQFIYVLQPQQQPKRIAQALPNLISCRLRKKNQNSTETEKGSEREEEREGGRERGAGRVRKTQLFAWLGQMIYSVFLCILLCFFSVLLSSQLAAVDVALSCL